ncbi:MAG: sec-independent protein translocase protein TatA [Actinomycetota bacterium]|nr:sec-independent protein translocase protein TatA [Actinomycetota bacterium]
MVAAIGLIVFGPRRLPEIARTLGKALAEFKRQASDIRSEFESGLNVDEASEDEKPVALEAEKPPQTPDE